MIIDERKLGRLVGTFIADLIFFSVVCSVGIFYINLVSKLLRIAITQETMKSANQNNDYPDNDF